VRRALCACCVLQGNYGTRQAAAPFIAKSYLIIEDSVRYTFQCPNGSGRGADARRSLVHGARLNIWRANRLKGENQVRLIKMLGLAATAAIAVMAFVGLSSASANFATTLCSVHPEALNKCPEANSLEHKHIEAESKHALLKAGFTILCKKSLILGQSLLLTAAGTRFIGHVETLTFEECSGGKVTVVDKTGLLLLLKTALNLGDVTAHGFEVLAEQLGEHCVYGGVAAGLHALGHETLADKTLHHAKVTANEVSLEELEGGFFCPNTAKWTATYTITLPLPVFIAS
jgi:hypothetical protein